jgi:hypothetical protein
MKSLLRVLALVAALAAGGCAGLVGASDRLERDEPPHSFCDYPRQGDLITGAFAAGQLLYEFSQDH